MKLNPLGKWLRLCHECDCGSEEIFQWYKNEKIFKYCEKCKDKKMKEYIEYWQDMPPPMSPNEYEVEIYRHHCKGHKSVCLLGMTKKLQEFCDFMVDLNPIEQNKPVVKCDWNLMDNNSEVCIGDGVLNLEGLQLVDKLLKKCDKLVTRVFLKKFSWIRYATHFPNSFPNASLIIPTQEDISIVIWENDK